MIQLVLMLACTHLTLDDSPEQKLAPQSVSAEVQRQPLEPFDEGKDDPEFAAFRNRLLKALDDRDFEHLMSIIPDEEFKCSFVHASRKTISSFSGACQVPKVRFGPS